MILNRNLQNKKKEIKALKKIKSLAAIRREALNFLKEISFLDFLKKKSKPIAVIAN